MSSGKCELCGLECELTDHHLVPQNVCRSAKYSKKLKTDESNILRICRTCHDFLHATFSNQELRDMYFTKELLLGNEDVEKFVKWRIKHPEFKGSSKMNGDRRRHW